MKVSQAQQKAINLVCKKLGLKFVRAMGSFVTAPSKAKDIDLVVFPAPQDLKKISLLVESFEKIFALPVDVIRFSRDLRPSMVLEIASTSIPLYEAHNGAELYAEMIEPLHGMAVDEELRFSIEDRRKSLLKRSKGKVKNVS